MDFSKNIAVGIDKVAITGGGAGEPFGILATSGTSDITPGSGNGTVPTWAIVLNFIKAIQNANGSALAFLTTPNMVAKLRGTVRVASTDSRMIMEEPNKLAGYPLGVSTNVPSTLVKGTSGSVCSAMIFGDFSEVLIGVWSAIDILANPFEATAYTKGNVQISRHGHARRCVETSVELCHRERLLDYVMGLLCMRHKRQHSDIGQGVADSFSEESA